MSINGIFPIYGSSVIDILIIAAHGIARLASCKLSNPGVAWRMISKVCYFARENMGK